MTDESVKVVNKSAFSEVSDGGVLIPIAANILIELSPVSPGLQRLLLLWSIHLRIPKACFQHQIDLLMQELEKNVTANNDFKNFIKKNWSMKERVKLTKLKFYVKNQNA